MAHNIDTTNGQSAFVSAREDAWHQLGTTLPDAFTAEEAMEHGLLGGWNVRKTPLTTVDEQGELLEVPGRFAVIRTNPVSSVNEVLSVMGAGYTPIQNEEHAELLNTLVDESGAHFETAGSIDGGRKVFITMKMPGHIKVGGADPIENYIAAVNSHDGSSQFTIMVTPIRIVCQNTMNFALAQASNRFQVRHTRGAHALIQQQARQALDMTFGYLEGFQEQAEQLINTTMTQVQFEEIIQKAFGAPEDAPAATITRRSAKVDKMAELFADAHTQEGIRDTAWAGLNAMTEWFDHFNPTRGEDPDTTRSTRALLDPGFKNQALNLMLSYV